MVFNPNIPQSTDFLSNSQSDLLTNNSQLDIVFGVDHYKYSDVSGNKGKHNYVTTPQAVNVPPTASGHPDTTSTELKFYAMQDTANIGLLQYSRGWDAVGAVPGVPSPVTYLQSPNSALVLADATNSSINILDFTGITDYAMGKIYIFNKAFPKRYAIEYSFNWNGTDNNMYLNEVIDTFPTDVKLNMNGNILRLFRSNTTSSGIANVYWTIEFFRIVV